MPLNALDIGSASPASKEAALFAPSGNNDPAGSAAAFGQVMARTLQQMAPADPHPSQTAGTPSSWLEDASGQALATHPDSDSPSESATSADPLAWPAWTLGWPGAQVVEQIHVGPSLQAITAKTAMPDDASLAAFARSQGLDAHAIAWLLDPTATPMPTQLAPENPATSALQVLQSLGAPTGPEAAATRLALLTPAQLATASGAPGMDPVPPLPAGAAALVGVAYASWTSSPSADKETSVTPSGNTPDTLAMLADKDSNPGLISLRWAQLNTVSGSMNSQPPGHRPGQATENSTWNESELDLSKLSIPESASTAEPVATSDTDSPTLTANSATARDAPGLATHTLPAVTAHDKTSASAQTLASRSNSDQMQQLADQMADAIGERMIREFERGHWNLRLMLKPAHLGHIEVEMRMRAGELDASFAAPQAATRELLQDGLSRLKDNLNQMGMDVASLDVRTGQNRQDGGDSTPGQKPNPTNVSNKETAEMPAQPTTGFTPRPRRADGWDVMV